MNPSGIYKREFLNRYHIRHNETAGASYQDQGFWFQIMLWTNRMMLLNEELYYYRQDNPGSSIADRGKVYCICEEYKFIYNILKKDTEHFTEMMPHFVCCMRTNYMGTYRRIDIQYKQEFLKRMQQDFQSLQKKGELAVEFLTEAEKKQLNAVISDSESFYQMMIRLPEQIKKQTWENDEIIIYGAGTIGKQIYLEMFPEERGKVIGFAVTDEKKNVNELWGIPVKEIKKYQAYREKAAVIIGTTATYQKEIQKTLEELQFQYYFTLPETAF